MAWFCWTMTPPIVQVPCGRSGGKLKPPGLGELHLDDGEEHEVQADRGGDLGEGRGVAQRPEDQQVEEQPHDRADDHGAEERPADGHRGRLAAGRRRRG